MYVKSPIAPDKKTNRDLNVRPAKTKKKIIIKTMLSPELPCS